MSGIGGILYFDDQDVDLEIIASIRTNLAPFGPDGGRELIRKRVSFVYCEFNTTPEAQNESQPADGPIVVTFDGRLDNRVELLKALEVDDPGIGDAGLIIAAYKRWGGGCFGRIQGDFAIALWDEETRKLFLARDPFGIRHLFFTINDNRIIWASSPSAILPCPDVAADVSEEYVGLFLAGYSDGLCSPFRWIKPVGAGTFLKVEGNKLTSHRYWDIREAMGRRLVYSTPDSYAEHFKELFLQAVSVRLRAEGPIVAELSGGLDSSSIVCAADAISKQSNGKTPTVVSLSYIYEGMPQADERDFIEEIERQRSRRGLYVLEREDPILARWPDPDFIRFPNIEGCYGGLTSGKLKAMQGINSRVVLSGLFGDQLFGVPYAPFEAADLVRAGHPLRAFALCRQSALRSHGRVFDILWNFGVNPNLPSWLRGTDAQAPEWIGAELEKRTDLSNRLRLLGGAECSVPSKSMRFRYLLEGINHFASGYAEGQTTFGCLETRYPFLHRPLVEFSLAIPLDQLARPGDPRALHRAGLSGILPERVRLRKDKKGPGQAVLTAITREWKTIQDLLSTSRAYSRGYVDSIKLLKVFEKRKQGQMTRSDPLRFIALELWLRALERRSLNLGDYGVGK